MFNLSCVWNGAIAPLASAPTFVYTAYKINRHENGCAMTLYTAYLEEIETRKSPRVEPQTDRRRPVDRRPY